MRLARGRPLGRDLRCAVTHADKAAEFRDAFSNFDFYVLVILHGLAVLIAVGLVIDGSLQNIEGAH